MSFAFSATISGRVQMVMYRDFTMRNAQKLGIVGDVKNISGGTVFVRAEGEKEKLEKLIVLLKRGPLLSRVDEVEVSWLQPTGMFDRFSILY